MTSPDVDEGVERGDEGTGPIDVDRLASALRWAIGRSPQTDEAADRRLLRTVAARLGPDVERTPTALDSHLAAVLAEVAASDELVDHADPRHRSWIGTMGRIYLCPPEGLPEDLRRRIGSETVLRHLGDGVSNRARAASRILGIAEGAVRVRREPPLLKAAAAALAARIEGAAPVAAPLAPGTAPAAGGARSPGAVDRRRRSRASRWRVRAAVAAVLLVLAVAAGLAVGLDDEPQGDAGAAGRPSAGLLGSIPPLPDGTSVLGLEDGRLVAVGAGASAPLGLDDVVAADAHRDGDTVHVVAELGTGRLVYGAAGPSPARWVDLGAGRRGAEVAVDRTGSPVVVAIEGDQGDLVRRTFEAGRPDGDWQRLSATGAVDIDLATNHDGRLEVGGVATTGKAFNIWQAGSPGGWSNYSDPRGGEDGRRVQAVANADGRLELFVERRDGTLWNTWQEAPARSWRTGWDPRYFDDVRQWRVAVGPQGRLVAVVLTDAGVLLRRQVPVPQADGTTKLMWPPSTEVEELDPLGGPRPEAITAVAGEEAVRVVATGAGRTVALDVDVDGVGEPEPLDDAAFDLLVPVDG